MYADLLANSRADGTGDLAPKRVKEGHTTIHEALQLRLGGSGEGRRREALHHLRHVLAHVAALPEHAAAKAAALILGPSQGVVHPGSSGQPKGRTP